MNENPKHKTWKDRHRAMQIAGFVPIGDTRYRHIETGLSFTLVPGGSFTMGMSDVEEQILQERPHDFETEFVEQFLREHQKWARPTVDIALAPFLIANFPLNVEFVVSRWGFLDHLCEDFEAAYVPGSSEVIPLLSELGLRLPSEAEWEYCHRQFLPPCHIPDDSLLCMEPENTLCGFGSYAEICADAWHPSLSGISQSGAARMGVGPRSVRGGAAVLAPWQGCGEWTLLMPYCRYSESQGELLSVRPAASIPSEKPVNV